MQKQWIPTYCRQREGGCIDRAFCRIHGKKLFLGEYGSPESKLKYAEVVASFQPNTAIVVLTEIKDSREDGDMLAGVDSKGEAGKDSEGEVWGG